MANKQSLLVKVSNGIHSEAKKDAKKFRVKLETVTEIAMKRFMELPMSMRAKEYAKHPKKIFGRPVV